MELKTTIKQHPKRKCSDLITKHIGEDVILELRDFEEHVCSGHLKNYAGRFLEITDFKQHTAALNDVINYAVGDTPFYDIESPKSIKYSLKTKGINRKLVASIQLYDDVISARKK